MEKNKSTIDFLIRQNYYKYQRLYNSKAMEYGETISIGNVLLMVEKEGTPSTQLGPKMGMESTSLSRTLKIMEEEGLIRRENSKIDKRMVLIFLTEKGVEKRKIAKEIVLGFDERISKLFSEKKMSIFYDMMSKIDNFLESELKKINQNN